MGYLDVSISKYSTIKFGIIERAWRKCEEISNEIENFGGSIYILEFNIDNLLNCLLLLNDLKFIIIAENLFKYQFLIYFFFRWEREICIIDFSFFYYLRLLN